MWSIELEAERQMSCVIGLRFAAGTLLPFRGLMSGTVPPHGKVQYRRAATVRSNIICLR